MVGDSPAAIASSAAMAFSMNSCSNSETRRRTVSVTRALFAQIIEDLQTAEDPHLVGDDDVLDHRADRSWPEPEGFRPRRAACLATSIQTSSSSRSRMRRSRTIGSRSYSEATRRWPRLHLRHRGLGDLGEFVVGIGREHDLQPEQILARNRQQTLGGEEPNLSRHLTFEDAAREARRWSRIASWRLGLGGPERCRDRLGSLRCESPVPADPRSR